MSLHRMLVGRLVIAFFVMLGCCVVRLRGMLMMLRRLLVYFVCHGSLGETSFCCSRDPVPPLCREASSQR
jgi:hypothetical protein